MKWTWSKKVQCWLRNGLIFGPFCPFTLCIVRELAGRGSVAVDVGISDMRQVKCNTWHVTYDIWHMTHSEIWCYAEFSFFKICSLGKIDSDILQPKKKPVWKPTTNQKKKVIYIITFTTRSARNTHKNCDFIW